MIIDHLSLAVDDKQVRHILHVHRALEFAVGVEQDVVIPVIAVHQRFDFLDVLPLINGNDVHLHAGLVLPVFIDLMDGFQLAHAGLAPGGKEGDDNRFALLSQLLHLHRTAIYITQSN